MPRPSDKKRRQGPEATDHEPPTPHAGGADTSIESECVPPLHDLVIATLRIAMDGFCVIDAKGQLLDANQALCDLLGYSRDELLQMSIRDFEAVESPEGIARHIAEIQAEGRDRFLTRHRRKDGARASCTGEPSRAGGATPKSWVGRPCGEGLGGRGPGEDTAVLRR